MSGHPPPSTAAGRGLALLLGAGAMAAVFAAVPSPLVDLDRYSVPKELVLHLTAFIAGLTLLATTPRPAPGIVDVLLLGFAAWSGLSAVLAVNHWLALRAFAVTISGLTVFWAARRAAADGAAPLVLGGLGIAVVAGALTGLAQAYGFDFLLLSGSRAPGGTLGNRNFLAHLTVIGMPLLFLWLLAAERRAAAGVAALGLALAFCAVVLTRSRAAWLGLLAAAAVTAGGWAIARVGGDRPGPRGRLRLAALAMAAAVLVALLLPNRLDWRSDSPYRDSLRRLTSYRDGSGRGRLIQYANSLRLVSRDPLFGAGPGNWAVKYPLVTTPGDPSYAAADPMPTNPWPSSDWIAFWTERGLPAALALLLAGAAAALIAIRRLRSDDPVVVRRALALLGVLTGTLVTGALDAVLLLATPVLVVAAAVGALLPTTGVVWRPRLPARRWLLTGAVLFGLLVVGRSGLQVAAILTAGPGWPLARVQRATRLDPASYRFHLMASQRAPCPAARPHAAAASRLYPYHPAPRQRLAACASGRNR